MYISNKKLSSELLSLIKEYGFSDVFSALEGIASNNADCLGGRWETVRENLEDSFLEVEEYLLSSNYN